MNIVIVGGGFAGLTAAMELARRQIGNVTLISDKPHFLHHGLLYSTATGGDPAESVIDIKEILKPYPKVKFKIDRIDKIDAETKQVSSKSKSYTYDQLILAPGLVEQFFGINGAKQHSYGIDTLESVRKFNQSFHDTVATGNKKVVCAVIGGGATGVELAGFLSEYVKRIQTAHDTTSKMQLTVVERSQRLLPGLSATASLKVTKRLIKQGVEVKTGQAIDRVASSYIVIDGKRQAVDMTVWTCGGKVGQLLTSHSKLFMLSDHGRVIVNQYLSAYPDIFVIGDSAEVANGGNATSAIKQARFVARHLSRVHNKQPLRHFNPGQKSLISMPISRFWAYSERHGVYISGFFGSLVRRLAEVNSYCRLLPFEKAYHIWRNHRQPSNICRLCRRNAKESSKSLAKA